MDDPITTGEAGKIIGIDASLVRRYCRRGDLPAQQVGRDWLIERADAKAFRPAPVGPPRAKPKPKPKPRKK